MINAVEEREATKDKESGMTRQDAGHIGGETTKKRYGSEHFSSIGRKGGKARGTKKPGLDQAA